MNLRLIALRGLRFYTRAYFALALGVACAVAVLTGALLVGDSVRGSLRTLALDRLGKIDHLLLVDRFFDPALSERLQKEPSFAATFSKAIPLILFPTAVAESLPEENASSSEALRATKVTVMGIEESFWEWSADDVRPEKPLQSGEVCLNETLAKELHAKVGSTVILRFPTAAQVPADSPFGQRTQQTASLANLKVVAILPGRSLGRFTLEPTQTAPRLAWVTTADLQEALDVDGRVNALAVSNLPGQPSTSDQATQLSKLLTPTVKDLGFTLKEVDQTFRPKDAAPETIFHYISVMSDRMLMDETSEALWKKSLASRGKGAGDIQELLTYLANSIARGGSLEAVDTKASIPYSTIAAFNPTTEFPLIDSEGKPIKRLAIDEIALTSWAAEDLKVKLGDTIALRYFEPESRNGVIREVDFPVELKLAAIIPLTEPDHPFNRRKPPIYDKPPTTANDPDLTPTVKGITDQASMSDWKAPFPFDYKKIRSQDDTYWENHRTTPKAYISKELGRKLWHSRFGNVTSLRLPISEDQPITIAEVEADFLKARLDSGELLGYSFLPLRAQGMQVSSGTTPFDVLFLLLSMFVITSALLLVWLLVRLAILQRASEIGLLMALGWPRKRVQQLLIWEGLGVVLVGSLIGLVIGIGYAKLMLIGLSTWWVGAISTPFLQFYITPQSLLIGFVSGAITTLITIYFSLRSLRDVSIRGLLSGEVEKPIPPPPPLPAHSEGEVRERLSLAREWGRKYRNAMTISASFAAVLLILAATLSYLATKLVGEAQAGAFMASGAAALTSLLLILRIFISSNARQHGADSLFRLAFRNLGRSRSRSLATVTLVAVASFLMVAVSSFRLAPTIQGIGGFSLLAESNQDLVLDFRIKENRIELFGEDAEKDLRDCYLAKFRVRPGDDASCVNLYTPAQPRILGVSPEMVEMFDDSGSTHFTFAGTAAKDQVTQINPWHLLDKPSHDKEPVNVILDKNTAMYSMKLYGGVGQKFTINYSDEEPIEFRVVGLLENSILQGSLLIGDADFSRLFPRISGHRFFLIHTPSDDPALLDKVSQLFESKFSDEGLDVVRSRDRLAELLAVQNTYISTFQALGALGLLLGTFGLVAVQLRNVLERRKELGLMRAIGFASARLGQVILLEHVMLLLLGLLLGVLAALLAVIPHMLAGGARVPFTDLLGLLLAVLLVGLATGIWAVRQALKVPVIPALRGE